jgi:predicted outer membrane lipoprotein
MAIDEIQDCVGVGDAKPKTLGHLMPDIVQLNLATSRDVDCNVRGWLRLFGSADPFCSLRHVRFSFMWFFVIACPLGIFKAFWYEPRQAREQNVYLRFFAAPPHHLHGVMRYFAIASP